MATASHFAAAAAWQIASSDAGDRARTLGWLVTAAGLPLAWAVLFASGMRIVPMGAVSFTTVVAILTTISIVYSRFRPDARVHLGAGVLAMMIVAAVSAGIISNAGLRLRRPLIDSVLLAADRAMGIDTPGIVLAFVGHSLTTGLLDVCYISAFPFVFATALYFAHRARADRVWEIGWSFSACISTASVIAALYPAIGSVPFAGLEGLSGHGLPAGSGTYYVAAFRALHDGFDPWLDLRKLEGVVTFPSFHIDMALIVAWAWRRRGMMTWAATLWCVAVCISTIPIGGHYVIDLAGGIMLWIGCVVVIRGGTQMPRSREKTSRPDTRS
jgi:hypothetical protein